MQNITQQFIDEYFKRPENLRLANSSKYDYGHVLVVAGSYGMLGAAILAAKAALKSGAGVVTCAVPEGIALVAMEHFVEVMVLAVPSKQGKFFDEDSLQFLKLFLMKRQVDVIVLGCGIGRQPETIKFVNRFVNEVKVPMVIDADALFSLSFSRWENNMSDLPVIMTPHEKELQRLLDLTLVNDIKNNRSRFCQKAAKKFSMICVLKGHKTLLSNGSELWQNTTGNTGMATAGTGDVLAGVIAGLFAQNNQKGFFDVAKVAVFLHGKAGDILREKYGERSIIASDLIEALKNV
ncbi:MAG: NAD(P)H-hydrate dehydratase [bacterium]|nr:NAD(P)H-hydrate dehydratase [bacterium]